MVLKEMSLISAVEKICEAKKMPMTAMKKMRQARMRNVIQKKALLLLWVEWAKRRQADSREMKVPSTMQMPVGTNHKAMRQARPSRVEMKQKVSPGS